MGMTLMTLLAVGAVPALAFEPFTCEVASPAATVEESGAFAAIRVDDGRYLVNPDQVGKPALPVRMLTIAVPDRATVTGVTCEDNWETLAENVTVVPVSEPVRAGEESPTAITDAAVYGGSEPYPANPIAVGGEDRMGGVRVVTVAVTPFRWFPEARRLERAKRLAITVGFASGGERSYVIAPNMLEGIRAAVENPEHVTTGSAAVAKKARGLALMSVAQQSSVTADYLLISPPDFVDDWNWYVLERKKAHPDITFLVKNTADIYGEYPFGGTNLCRNAAESIHAYLRANRETMKFSYVVLGGAWLDAQNRKGTKPVFYGGETMSLSNCVPGVYGYPREDWREIPSDMFYACLDMKNSQKYPWDANENNIYIDQGDCSNNDLRPDVCVTRITLNPYRPNGWTAYNRHALVTNYVAKLARGESSEFYGHFRYGLSPDSTGSRRLRANGDRMYYDELEFYDNMYNMADPRHSKYIEDNEVEPRRRIKYQFGAWRPVLEAKGMASYTWTKGFDTLSQASADYYASDRDYGFVYSHGWAQGATHFQAYGFATGKGLTILNGSNGPCDTGYVDYHVNMNGTPTLQYNLGDSGVTNPDGGALASINNTRWGWAGGSHTGIDFDSSMSYFMLNRSLVGFNQLYCDVGHAWFKGVSDYAAFGFTQGGGTHTWTLTEQICYGDPLVRLPAPQDRWWRGGATGVWDRASACWSASGDGDLTTFYPASNVYFAAESASQITVVTNVGAMRLDIPITPNGRFSIVGEGNGELRVMKKIDVTGGDLVLDVKGGVGHDGIEFFRAEGQSRAGELTVEGTNYFYIAKVTGAGRVNLRGGETILDVDNFPAATLPVVLDGPGKDAVGAPNEIRSYRAGNLTRFSPIAITNSHLKLSTADAFGRGDVPAILTLNGSRLEIAANAFYERKGCYQVNGYAENLNATVDVGGDSEVTSSIGGLWTVSKVTTFNLGQSTDRLVLAAATKNCGGKIVLNGTGTVEVSNADALSGEVEVASGIRLVLKELPLASVTKLSVAAGATVEMPHEKSGYWQILPVSSRLEATGVTFCSANAPDEALEGTASQSGAFFRKGALYEWTEADGHWSEYLAHRYPKILFGDLAGACSATVRVDLAVSPEFVSFANGNTSYRFVAAAADASITLDTVILNGDTAFDLPLSATEYVEALGGTVSFAEVIAPTVRIGPNASLVLTGSHWTTFVLEDGATLTALPGTWLDWNDETDLTIESAGAVAIDVSALELTDEPQKLIAGSGHAWTVADLGRFEVIGQPAELRIVGGALCVVRGENLKGPYAFAFAGSTNWNHCGWTSDGTNRTPFARIWSESALDWTSDVDLVPPFAAVSEQTVTITVDCDVVAQTVAFGPTSNRLVLATKDRQTSFEVSALDLQSCIGGVEVNLDTGNSDIICPTNENAVTILRGSGTGAISFTTGTLELQSFGGRTINAGAQGTIRLVAPPGWQTFKVASVASGFQLDSNVMEVTDSDGNKVSGYSFKVTDNVLWCTPSGVQAVVSSGTNEWSTLAWTDPFGGDASDVDWKTVSGFTLVGGEGAVVSSTNGFAGVLDRLSAKGPVKIVGNLTWTPSKCPSAGDLVLGGGFKVKVNLASNLRILDGARLGFADDATLEVSHGGGQANVSDQDWSGLSGTGTFLHLNSNAGNWLAWPAKGPQGGFSYYNGADVVLTESVSEASPLAVRNLSGRAGFRSDWGSGSMMRPVRTVQTRVSDFGGTFAAISSSRDSKLYVGSDAPAPTVEKALIVSGGNPNSHVLEIETNGCVILTGTWKGTINVRGELIVTNESVLSGVTVRYCPEGKTYRLTNEIPAVASVDLTDPPAASTVAPERVLPVGPEEETPRIDVTDPATNVTSFTGIVRLVDGVGIAVRSIPAFTLATDSVGRVEIRLSEVPTANGTTLVMTEAGFAPSTNVTVTLRDRFGNQFVAPVSVAWKEGGYYAYVQSFNSPAYRHTFDGSVVNPNYNATDLAETTDSKYFIPSRDGQAIVNYYYGSKNGWNLMSPFPTAWTVNMVAKMPTNTGGVLFGFGYGGYCDKGFCFAANGTDSAALCIWRNWNVTSRLAAEVPLSATQFHVYTATYDGAEVRFYVDGELMQTLADTEGFTAGNGGCYQFWGLCSGKYPGGLGGASGGAVDDWSFYKFCATPESVRYLASQFPVWPECREARVIDQDQALDALEWSEGGDETLPYMIAGDGGSLRLDGVCTFTQPVRTSGKAMVLKLVGEGLLEAHGGLSAKAAITLDATGLDGDEIAANAVYGLPYSRWLIRGAISGTVEVANLPAMPHGYAIRSEVVNGFGVRLVATAPWFAKYGSKSFNFAGNTDKSTYSAATRVSDNDSCKNIAHGAFAVLGKNWTDLEAKNKVTTADGMSVSVSGVANAYGTGKAVGDQILYGYADDSAHPTVVVSNIPYAKFRLVTYHATDTANAYFCPVWMGATAEDAVRYCGPTCNSSTGGGSVWGWSDVAWGDSDERAALSEGVNYLVSDVITGEVGKATAFIRIPKLSPGRACLAAFQIVEVRGVFESSAVDYSAIVTNDTAWADGNGAGLVHDVDWLNDTNSLITLQPQAVGSETPTLTFDTAVTAGVLKVASAAGERLGLNWSGLAPLDVGSLDLREAKGETVFTNCWFGGIPLESGTGTRIRFDCEATAPLCTGQGLVVAYRKADFSAAISPYNWVLRTEDDGDAVTLNAKGNIYYLPIDVAGGTVTYHTGGATECSYGGIANTATNSVITVSGGTFVCDVTGMGKGSARGLIVGVTGGAKVKPKVVVNGGVFDCSGGQLALWEYGSAVQSGGILKARGIYKGGNNAGGMTLSGGITELGEGGISQSADNKLATVLSGGTVRSVKTASVAVPVTLSAASCAMATNGTTLTFTKAVTGGGGITVGAADWTGEVVFGDAASRLGSVTVAAGTRITVPWDALTGDLLVGEGAVLNVTKSGGFAEVTNRICAGALTMASGAVMTLNGAALPKQCTLEGDSLIVNAENRTWTNPVTGEGKAFTYRFTGGVSGDWREVDNWDRYEMFGWERLAGSNVPLLPDNGIFDPVVVDGSGITNPANRTVSLKAMMEGWTTRLAALNGVTVEVASINKFQSQSGEKWIWVDATSQIRFGTLGDKSYDGNLPLYVAASNGIVIATGPAADGATFQYYLKGEGSVGYGAALAHCGHAIRRADFRLRGCGIGKAVRRRLLVGLDGGSSVKFALGDATVTMEDPLGEMSGVEKAGPVTEDDAIGSYVITQRENGVWLDYVDRGDGTSYTHEVATTGGVREVEVPFDWLRRLSHGDEPMLALGEFTPVNIALALESTLAPNGLKPWQSYVLGLDPTNELDDIRCTIEFRSDGKLCLAMPNVDPKRQPDSSRLRYVLQHKTLLGDEWQDHSSGDAPSNTVEKGTGESGFYRYRIELVK